MDDVCDNVVSSFVLPRVISSSSLRANMEGNSNLIIMMAVVMETGAGAFFGYGSPGVEVMEYANEFTC